MKISSTETQVQSNKHAWGEVLCILFRMQIGKQQYDIDGICEYIINCFNRNLEV